MVMRAVSTQSGIRFAIECNSRSCGGRMLDCGRVLLGQILDQSHVDPCKVQVCSARRWYAAASLTLGAAENQDDGRLAVPEKGRS